MEEIKQVPYGVSDFVTVRERNLYYVDKTMYLSLLEQQPDNLFYIRPRRFGKSLFISMLQAYYDKAMTDRFDSLFGGLWVHDIPHRSGDGIRCFIWTFHGWEETLNSFRLVLMIIAV